MSLGLSPEYYLIAELKAPDFAAERAFLTTERRYVATQLAKPVRRGLVRWLWQRIDRTPRRADWHRYDRALERYSERLDKVEAELKNGLLPLLLWVHYDGQEADRGIRVSVTVSNGRIHRRQRKLERPKPIDHTKPAEWAGLANVARGFWRSNIKITPLGVRARLSRLGAGERAAITSEVVYVETRPSTRLTWEVTSRQLSGSQHGAVELPANLILEDK